MMENIVSHAQVLGKGFIRMLVGAVTAGAGALAVYGFIAVTRKAGYAAVGDFLLSLLAMIFAVCGVYIMGGRNKKEKKGGPKK